MSMSFAEALAAAIAVDPYPLYAAQLAAAPFAPAGPGRWIASSAAVVERVLSDPAFGVRGASVAPPANALAAFAARTIRRNDGPPHARLRPMVSARLNVDVPGALQRAASLAQALWKASPGDDARRVDALAAALPTAAVAASLGLDPLDRAIHDATRRLARALAPDAEADSVASGAEAAEHLCSVVTADDIDERANLAAFFVQAYDATAGLIGNTLLTLGRDRALWQRVEADATLIVETVTETARFDAPVQNTRRTVLDDITFDGNALRANDVVLVLLAAANRDPAVNPEPARFLLDRPDRRSFTFGRSRHACPGETAAVAIAAAAVKHVIDEGVDLARLALDVRYRRSVNARIPLFSRSEGVTVSSYTSEYQSTTVTGATL